MTAKRLISLLLLFAAILTGTSLSAQDLVSDVDSRQQDNSIFITYRLLKKSDVTIYYSLDRGRTYNRLYSVSGDVGTDVAPGRKTAVWDVLSQVDGLTGDVVFKVEAFDRAEAKRLAKKSKSSSLKTRTVISYMFGFPTTESISGQSVSTDFTMGVMVGRVKRFGWYVNGQFSISSEDDDDSDFDYGSDYEEPYKDLTFNSVAAGAMLKIIKPVDIYAGPAVIWGRTELSESSSTYTGFGVDAGICLNWEFIDFSVGVTVPVIHDMKPLINFGVGLYF